MTRLNEELNKAKEKGGIELLIFALNNIKMDKEKIDKLIGVYFEKLEKKLNDGPLYDITKRIMRDIDTAKREGLFNNYFKDHHKRYVSIVSKLVERIEKELSKSNGLKDVVKTIKEIQRKDFGAENVEIKEKCRDIICSLVELNSFDMEFEDLETIRNEVKEMGIDIYSHNKNFREAILRKGKRYIDELSKEGKIQDLKAIKENSDYIELREYAKTKIREAENNLYDKIIKMMRES